MNAEQLRALQAPLKQRYKDDPATARITSRAEGILEPGDIACTVRAWHGEVTAGLHEAGGERVFLADGHGQHAHVRLAAHQLAGGLQAADAGHLHVHQDDVGLEFPGQAQGVLAGFGLAHHLQALDVGQHAGNSGAHQIVVIDHQHLDHTAPHA